MSVYEKILQVMQKVQYLQKDGYVIYSDRYELEDPFFKEWIIASNN